MKTKYYLNLTNGIEATLTIPNYSFIRIQSTACEQKRWNFILAELDYDFLLNMAIGNKCIVIDYSASKEIPRSLYQGLEWIKYVLNIMWFDKEIVPYVKNNQCLSYFRTNYKNLNKDIKIKLKYFRKFLHTDRLNIEILSGRTTKDGDYNYYSDLLIKD